MRHWLRDRLKPQEGRTTEEIYDQLLKVVEPALLDEVMRRVQGNRWVAAQWLGLNRATVRKKLGIYGLTEAHLPKGAGVLDDDDDKE